ncbi:MAG TPA: RDD family protein [Acidimicrobiia bacterium]|jgi:uncharacterized RDD family membrane protein YckC|nr:RDD family protein [Acidimicrobiia bacterium]
MTRPALVEGRDPTQVITRRCIGFSIDAFLLAAIPAATVLVVGHAELRKGACPHPLPSGRDCVAFRQQVMLVDQGAFLLFFGLLVLLYLVVFVAVQGITGASPGKALLRIRVIRADGSPPGTLRSLVRVVAWLVDGLTLLVPVALWSAWFTPGHRRVGDWLAGTYVVRGRSRAPAKPSSSGCSTRSSTSESS